MNASMNLHNPVQAIAHPYVKSSPSDAAPGRSRGFAALRCSSTPSGTLVAAGGAGTGLLLATATTFFLAGTGVPAGLAPLLPVCARPVPLLLVLPAGARSALRFDCDAMKPSLRSISCTTASTSGRRPLNARHALRILCIAFRSIAEILQIGAMVSVHYCVCAYCTCALNVCPHSRAAAMQAVVDMKMNVQAWGSARRVAGHPLQRRADLLVQEFEQLAVLRPHTARRHADLAVEPAAAARGRAVRAAATARNHAANINCSNHDAVIGKHVALHERHVGAGAGALATVVVQEIEAHLTEHLQPHNEARWCASKLPGRQIC
jgi:hypothetical protein